MWGWQGEREQVGHGEGEVGGGWGGLQPTRTERVDALSLGFCPGSTRRIARRHPCCGLLEWRGRYLLGQRGSRRWGGCDQRQRAVGLGPCWEVLTATFGVACGSLGAHVAARGISRLRCKRNHFAWAKFVVRSCSRLGGRARTQRWPRDLKACQWCPGIAVVRVVGVACAAPRRAALPHTRAQPSAGDLGSTGARTVSLEAIDSWSRHAHGVLATAEVVRRTLGMEVTGVGGARGGQPGPLLTRWAA